jgi:hypothetical protein
MERFLIDLPGHEEARFVELPEWRQLDFADVVGRVEVPLGRLKPGIDDPGTLRSSTIVLPPGRYRVSASLQGEWLPCNGQGCFAPIEGDGTFATRVELARFHLRGSRPGTELRLELVELERASATARQSISLRAGTRLHSLDDNAFAEPRGFWVKGASRARFALEGRGPVALSLANGARENWVEVLYGGEKLRFSLRPRATKRLTVPVEEGTALLSVQSESGFRPMELEEETTDRRYLGVFLTSPRPSPGIDAPPPGGAINRNLDP